MYILVNVPWSNKTHFNICLSIIPILQNPKAYMKMVGTKKFFEKWKIKYWHIILLKNGGIVFI